MYTYTFNEGYKKTLGLDINGINMHGYKIAGGMNAKPMQSILALTGKVAIVTGGAMGLGFCIVNRLCEAGASVVIADIAVEYAEKAIEFFETKNYTVKFIKTDVRIVSEIQAAVDFTLKEFGSIDILVNDAAVWRMARISDLSEESWNEIVDTNLKGTVFFNKIVSQVMAKQGRRGKIVNIASVAGLSMESSVGFMVEYVASKSGVIGITKSLAREMKPLGININCVIPGGMLSPGTMNMQIPTELKEIRNTLPPTPVADPDEVARMVYVMTTEVSDFMHGATIVVDGGASLMMPS